jgi:hypothetical protein
MSIIYDNEQKNKNKMTGRRGGCGKSSGPVLLHGKITTCRAWRPRNIIMWNEGQKEN